MERMDFRVSEMNTTAPALAATTLPEALLTPVFSNLLQVQYMGTGRKYFG